MAILKKFVTDTLKNSPEYEALCIAKVGTALNYYRSAPTNNVVEDLPFLTAYSDTFERDDTSQEPWNQTWIIPVAIGIESSSTSADDDGVDVWNSTDKVEELAVEAIEILRKETNGCGVNNENINLLKTEMVISEIGEADDVQASIFITFGKLNSI